MGFTASFLRLFRAGRAADLRRAAHPHVVFHRLCWSCATPRTPSALPASLPASQFCQSKVSQASVPCVTPPQAIKTVGLVFAIWQT